MFVPDTKRSQSKWADRGAVMQICGPGRHRWLRIPSTCESRAAELRETALMHSQLYLRVWGFFVGFFILIFFLGLIKN